MPLGARRLRQQEAVLGVPSTRRAAPADASHAPIRPVSGTILDASPHLLVLHTAGGEVRLPMTDATAVWHGGRGTFAALRPGREAIVRPAADGLRADRVWVDIGRVSGVILACGRDTVEVDMGPHRGRAHVVLPPHALGRVLVRHPRLEPGYLIDVICVRSADGQHGVRPGTSQPGYRADDLAAPEPGARVPDPIRGTATWFGGAHTKASSACRAACGGGSGAHSGAHGAGSSAHAAGRGAYGGGSGAYGAGSGVYGADSCAYGAGSAGSDWHGGGSGAYGAGRRAYGAGSGAYGAGGAYGGGRGGFGGGWGAYGVVGAAYPAVDSEGDSGGCPGAPAGCVALPYLSLGSGLSVLSECTGRTAAVPVIECGCAAALYCDRCVECGTSPRGRVVELTPAAFVSLGGDLEAGCFNAVVRPGMGG
ncbi:hypothetical protein ACGFNU_02750 [Spirillospora sp. NPDC048911]|uniref:hypothetical protein n=1 Tax=Spirillospora sp. NPDC048911 TaxID=3364527 RepID=UPI00371C8484